MNNIKIEYDSWRLGSAIIQKTYITIETNLYIVNFEANGIGVGISRKSILKSYANWVKDNIRILNTLCVEEAPSNLFIKDKEFKPASIIQKKVIK